MKTATVLLVVGFASTPVLAGAGIDWLTNGDVRRVLAGEDLRSVADEIAKREFTPLVALSVLASRDTNQVQGDLGQTIRADAGQVYRHYTLQVTNSGRLDVAVHTYHFTARDESRALHKAQLGLEAKFEVNDIRTGEWAAGEVVFLVDSRAQLATLAWQGELANATIPLPIAVESEPAPPPEDPPDP